MASVIVCRPLPVAHPDARAMLRAYFIELVDRYHGRPMPVQEAEEAMAEFPSDDLTPFLVAYRTDEPVGCVGLRVLQPTIGELKRMYVVPTARRLGVGGRLIVALEDHARGQGMTELRLDTRNDLVEARALYARHGFVEGPAHNDDPYADHWFAKNLRQPAAQTPVP
jgi:GNAT superfamily N-acetyltransferase